MIRLSQVGPASKLALVENSPLRKADPRAKLALCLGASLTVMLPLERLVFFMLGYVALLAWARLLRVAGKQVWRLKWVLMLLFALDWWLIGLEHAVTIVARLILLAGIFSLFFATTTTRELSLALERLSVPHRYAFSLGVAFQSIGLLGDEWRTILEAQRARGAWQPPTGLRKLIEGIRDWVSLTVPAIVMTTKRAWAITEAAYARGFDSPNRRPYHRLSFSPFDWVLLAGTILVLILLFFL
jgi:energy-coupling factor transporter transmembrane protein EcfT